MHTAPNEALAEMIAGTLAARGWTVFVRSAGIPHMGPAAPHDVLVPEEQAPEVRRVLARMLAYGAERRARRRSPPGPPQRPAGG